MIPLLTLSLILSWVQVRSDTFIVKSAVGEERAKLVLRELEDFHQLVGTLVFDKTRLPELPIEVLLIGDVSQLKELAPFHAGQRREFAGYYQPGQDRDFIVLSNRLAGRTLASVVYHELTHYFLSRSLADRPMWLAEGLAEYFATADINGGEIHVGGISSERLLSLKTYRPIPLETFFQIDQRSPYYNEASKANAFYAQAWAFVHYLQNRHAAAFRQYIDALVKGPADLSSYVGMSPSEMSSEFNDYVSWSITRASRLRIQTQREEWKMTVEPIADAEAQMSISEIFIAMGKIDEARRHLEALAELDTEYPRASYYRGLLAQLSNENGDARDLFVDALMDANMGPRAAISLVQIGELEIPAVRATLQQAAAQNTRVPDVYWALSEIYLEDIRKTKETAALTAVVAPLPSRARAPALEVVHPEPVLNVYAAGSGPNIQYRLLSASGARPGLQHIVAPYYPDQLLNEGTGGQVIMDLQITDAGAVSGVWLVSAMPEVLGGLATAAVRQWQFEAGSTKIRMVLEFVP